MKQVTILIFLFLFFTEPHLSQNKVEYCIKTTWTKNNKGTKYDSYGQFGVINSIALNKFGDTLTLLKNTYDILGRLDTTSYTCFQYYEKVLYNYSDYDASRSYIVKRNGATSNQYRTIYKGSSNLKIATEHFFEDTSYTYPLPSQYNLKGKEIYDGYHKHNTCILDSYNNATELTITDSINRHINIRLRSLNQCGPTVAPLYITTIKKQAINQFKYDDNNNLIEQLYYIDQEYYDKTTHIYDLNNNLIRSFGTDFTGKEWEVIFERIPCNYKIIKPKRDKIYQSIDSALANKDDAKILTLEQKGTFPIPNTIGLLVNLTELYIQVLSISLPKSIGELNKLEQLYLVNNVLDTLPAEINNCHQLRILNLTNNKLTSLPDISSLISLTDLKLNNNELRQLPDSFDSLTKLVYLNLTGNKLKQLPQSLISCLSMRKLNLANNRLDTFPNSILSMIQIQELNLGGNKISTLPSEVSQLTELKSLILFGNHIYEIPNNIGKLKHLKELGLSYNNLNELPTSLSKLTELKMVR
jgi:Leucine-rich repeat (LRR) protein